MDVPSPIFPHESTDMPWTIVWRPQCLEPVPATAGSDTTEVVDHWRKSAAAIALRNESGLSHPV